MVPLYPDGGLAPLAVPLVEVIEPAALLQDALDVADSEENSASRRAMNSTAYRIFKLLQWLMESPMSVDAMNARFCEDPRIGKPVSSDSIWLYINTLKELGCRIRRPSVRNGFQYDMQSHPFGLLLNDAQLDMLVQAKAHAHRNFTPQEMLILDRMLKKIVVYGMNDSTDDDPKRLIEHLFTQSRSFDYEDCGAYIEALETWIAQGQLLWLGYRSPQHGQEAFHFLPTLLFYEQGVVYIRGERSDFNTPSNLRLDRILSLEAVEKPDVLEPLLERTTSKMEVVLHIMVDSPEGFLGLQLGEHQGVYEEISQWNEGAGCYEVTLQVRELFYVKQRLLACGLPFRILAPLEFKQDVTDTLQAMLGLYQSEGRIPHGNA